MTGQSELERATALLGQGQPKESAALTAAILAREPENAIAAHLLGLALKDLGDWEQGAQWMRFSIKIEPKRPEFRINLGHLLRKRQFYGRAEKVYRSALALAPQDRGIRRSLALTLIDLGRFGDAEALSRALTLQDPADAEAWLILGMALANLERLPEAEAAYRRALELDPNDAVAQHNLGALLVRLEKPEAAAALAQARRLGADGYEAAYNRGRAALNVHDPEAAEAEFQRAVDLQPASLDAQLNLARIRFMRGDPKFARSLAAAVGADRDDVALQLLYGDVLGRAGQLSAAEALLQDLLKRKGPSPIVQAKLSEVLLEGGRLQEAETQALEAATALPDDPAVVQTLVSALLARGGAAEALPFIEAQRRRFPDSQAWLAYEASAARSLGSDRYAQLYDYDRLIRVFDLEAPPGWSSVAELNRALTAALDAQHRFDQHPFDQTLRNGTQTTRSLLTDPDPAVQALLAAFAAPIEAYRRALGTDPAHPLSAANQGVAQFSGAWSVRLRRSGFHVNHVHPEGLISSAYYVEVPPETQDATLKSGWIKFGEPRYPVPGATPERFVQPLPGRLVLFPSYMWHGTNAIHADLPRTCVAFDVRVSAAGASAPLQLA